MSANLKPMALLVLGTLFLAGCGEQEAESGPEHGQPVVLDGEVFFQSSDLGLPLRLRATGPSLWVVDAAGDPALHELDAETGELLQSVGRRGDGPGELQGAQPSIVSDPRDPDGIWAWDVSPQRMTWFPSAHGGPPEEDDVRFTVPFSVSPRVLRMDVLADGRLVGQSASDDERFAFLSFDGEELGRASGPVLEHPDVPLERQIAHTNESVVLCSGPEGGFVVAYTFAGRIEIHDARGELTALADVPDPFPLYAERADGSLAVGTRAGYVSCTSDDERIYALHSGLELPEDGSVPDSVLVGTDLHVFDPSGELVDRLALDRGVTTITLGSNGWLYGGSIADATIHRWAWPPPP